MAQKMAFSAPIRRCAWSNIVTWSMNAARPTIVRVYPRRPSKPTWRRPSAGCERNITQPIPLSVSPAYVCCIT